eukprot:6212361-Pleurochrysis_carterae.AAC.1
MQSRGNRLAGGAAEKERDIAEREGEEEPRYRRRHGLVVREGGTGGKGLDQKGGTPGREDETRSTAIRQDGIRRKEAKGAKDKEAKHGRYASALFQTRNKNSQIDCAIRCAIWRTAKEEYGKGKGRARAVRKARTYNEAENASALSHAQHKMDEVDCAIRCAIRRTARKECNNENLHAIWWLGGPLLLQIKEGRNGRNIGQR